MAKSTRKRAPRACMIAIGLLLTACRDTGAENTAARTDSSAEVSPESWANASDAELHGVLSDPAAPVETQRESMMAGSATLTLGPPEEPAPDLSVDQAFKLNSAVLLERAGPNGRYIIRYGTITDDTRGITPPPGVSAENVGELRVFPVFDFVLEEHTCIRSLPPSPDDRDGKTIEQRCHVHVIINADTGANFAIWEEPVL